MDNLLVPLYEDNHLLAINKPAGVLSQGDKTGDTPLVDMAKDYIKIKYNKPGNVFLGLCHRLDRPVSGVLLLARTSKALERVNKMFQKSQIRKTYWAVSHRAPSSDQGRIEHILVKDSKKNQVTIGTATDKGGKLATTDYQVLGSFENFVLVQLEPHSGRSHQLRVAMQSLRAPILGDVKYGGKTFDPSNICLHCRSLEFIHPVTKEKLKIVAPTPDAEPWVYF